MAWRRGGVKRWALAMIALLAVGCSGDDGSKPSGAGGAAGSGGSSGSGGGGGATPPPLPSVTKFDILGAAGGSGLSDELCAAKSQPAGCDLCDALGFYGDLECDTSLIDAALCLGPDPDCAPAPADYFVAPNGNDANDGSEANPFSTVQKAQDVAKAGDRIYLRGGTYHPTDSTHFKAAGSAAEPILLLSYPGELPIIDAANIPEGDTDGPSTPTWDFDGAKHWRIHGPLRLTNGRGAGVTIEGDTEDIELSNVESSYNGQSAARGGHGFSIVEAEWANAKDIRFINCDAHHNANHLTRAGENVAENQYQHGDGWRIKSGENIQLVGCRSWHNLDDNYDLVWATSQVSLYECWSGFAGRDDAQGTITGTPGFEAAWGEGIKLGYADDTGPHSCIRCLSWKNVHLGFRMDGGPYLLENCASFENGRRPFGWELGAAPNVLQNNLDLGTPKQSSIPATTTSTHNSWDSDSTFTVAADDFQSVNDAALLGPRSSDGSLPVVPFLRLSPGSDLGRRRPAGRCPERRQRSRRRLLRKLLILPRHGRGRPPRGSGTGAGSMRLLVRHRRATRSRERDDLEALEARFGAPFAEVGARVVERIAELDQHVERHQQAERVLASFIVD